MCFITPVDRLLFGLFHNASGSPAILTVPVDHLCYFDCFITPVDHLLFRLFHYASVSPVIPTVS